MRLDLLLFCAVAFFVFFAAAAGAGVVAAYLFACPALGGLAGVSRAGKAGCIQIALLLAMELLLQRIDGGGGLTRGNGDLARLAF